MPLLHSISFEEILSFSFRTKSKKQRKDEREDGIKTERILKEHNKYSESKNVKRSFHDRQNATWSRKEKEAHKGIGQ